MLELDILREEYLDVHEGIQSEIFRSKYHILGKADRSKNNKIKAEESFPMSEQRYTMSKLLDGTEYQILLDTGARKSFMTKS